MGPESNTPANAGIQTLPHAPPPVGPAGTQTHLQRTHRLVEHKLPPNSPPRKTTSSGGTQTSPLHPSVQW